MAAAAATILHLLGLDRERLAFPHAGHAFRLIDVHGAVVTAVLAKTAAARR